MQMLNRRSSNVVLPGRNWPMALRACVRASEYDRVPAFFILTSAVFSLALVLGGGTIQGLTSDAIVELASLPLLGWAVARIVAAPRRREAIFPVSVACGIVILLLLHLIPLPPSVWTSLPGRYRLVETYDLIGLDLPWWPLSLQPEASCRALLSILPATAIFLAILTVEARQRRLLTVAFVVFAGLSVLLGLLQVMQGRDSAFRFYEFTNQTSSVGFFANRNHYATLLCAAVPFTLGWTIYYSGARRQGWQFGSLAMGLLAVIMILGIALSYSRAGFALAVFAFGTSVFLLDFDEVKKSRRAGIRAVLLGVSLVAVAAVGYYALPGLIESIVSKTDVGVRTQTWEITRVAAARMFPTGAGFGAFQTVYEWFDRPEALIAATFVNRAHNDWLELVVEAGLPAVLLMLSFLSWYLHRAWRSWNSTATETSLDIKLARAGSLSVLVILLHSFVDYPLRTLAAQAIFAFCCSLLVAPLLEANPEKSSAKRRSVSKLRPSFGRIGGRQ